MQRQYWIHSEAWIASSNPLPLGVIEEVHFTFLHDDGSCVGEGRMSWYDLGHEVAPRLEVFNDGWSMLGDLASEGLLGRLRAIENLRISPARFCALLGEFGFDDRTPRGAPPNAPGVATLCPMCHRERGQ